MSDDPYNDIRLIIHQYAKDLTVKSKTSYDGTRAEIVHKNNGYTYGTIEIDPSSVRNVTFVIHRSASSPQIVISHIVPKVASIRDLMNDIVGQTLLLNFKREIAAQHLAITPPEKSLETIIF